MPADYYLSVITSYTSNITTHVYASEENLYTKDKRQ